MPISCACRYAGTCGERQSWTVTHSLTVLLPGWFSRWLDHLPSGLLGARAGLSVAGEMIKGSDLP